MNLCYAVGVTDQGDELRCSLDRNHKTEHWDAVRDQRWSVDLNACPWAMAGARG